MAKDLFPSPTPLTLPHHEEDWLAWLRLLRSRRVGPSTFTRLMGEHGSAQAALKELPLVAKAAGVENYETCSEKQARAELKAGKLAGARLVALGSADYPAHLAEIPDAPPLVWVLGSVALLNKPMIAMVGARNASSLGTRMARKLAGELADAGYLVVSGLARGVDTAAHLGAMQAGTLAVMAGGVDVVYPAENACLAQELLETGARLSEQPMGLRPQARHFPQRNRIISGLCRAVVVVEAAARSGSLITAKCALDQGREVLAVPGHPFDARASGCNFLIRDGATLVRGVDDVIATLSGDQLREPAAKGPARQLAASLPQANRSQAKPTPDLRDANRLHKEILSRLGPSPVTEDQLIRDLKLSPSEVTPALLNLELDGKIDRQPGALLSLAT